MLLLLMAGLSSVSGGGAEGIQTEAGDFLTTESGDTLEKE